MSASRGRRAKGDSFTPQVTTELFTHFFVIEKKNNTKTKELAQNELQRKRFEQAGSTNDNKLTRPRFPGGVQRAQVRTRRATSP